jgi:DNA-binding NtrC family response regulator
MLSNVLVVDDEAEMRKMLSAILEDEGYSVETAGDGKNALKICQKTPFDVALIDIELPDMKGTKLLGALKEIQPKMVRIIVTGHPSVENAITAVNEKADAYVLKPVNPKQLLELISGLLTTKSNEYLIMFKEVEEAKERTPIFKYNRPDRW